MLISGNEREAENWLINRFIIFRNSSGNKFKCEGAAFFLIIFLAAIKLSTKYYLNPEQFHVDEGSLILRDIGITYSPVLIVGLCFSLGKI